MHLVLQPMIWSDGHSRPDDYEIVHEGQRIGRICRINTRAKERWCWTQFGPPLSTRAPNGGIADSLDEADTAFRTAWEQRAQPPQKSKFPEHAGKRGAISITWADKFAMALAAIAAMIAAILAPNLSVYPTAIESVGAAIGLFVGMAAVFVLPLWLILRIAVSVTRAFGAEGKEAFRRA